MLLKIVKKSILKKDQDQHFVHVKENFLDSQIQVNLDDLLVIVCMCLSKKEALRQCVAKHVDLYVS